MTDDPLIRAAGDLNASQLEQFFVALRLTLADRSPALASFFEEVGGYRKAPRPPIRPDQLGAFFNDIREPIEAARERGGHVNPWRAAGIGKRETRVSAALAALWREDFAGATSRQFLALWLAAAIPDLDLENWQAELRRGYDVHTEECPMDERCDRVDVIIVTQAHLIAVEIKIGAGLGSRQLERYRAAMTRWAEGVGKTPHVILLARHRSLHEGVATLDWHSVTHAAQLAARSAPDAFSQLIGHFGGHVATF